MNKPIDNDDGLECLIQCNKEIVIFDTDNLLTLDTISQAEQAKDQSDNQNSYQIDHSDKIEKKEQVQITDSKPDQKIIQKLEEELRYTQQNIFNMVKIEQSPVKKIPKIARSLNSIQNKEHSPNSILKQGYMEKKTDSFLFKWKRRYFTLTPQKLFFFENHKKQKVIGCINIKIIPLIVSQKDGEIVLDFQGECQNIHLKCQNQKETCQWKYWIDQVSKYQLKQKKIWLKTMKKGFYSELNTISERQFHDTAQTGDILLFYTKHVGAKLQRVFTNSDFDHVAMVVKFRRFELMVFQSSLSNGVSLFQWKQYVRYFNLYEKITLRKLISPRKAQIQSNLLNFVKANLGRKYDLNISKFFTFQSDFNWEQVKKEEDKRGYFCSQLIAKAYKSIGLLDPKKSSCRYWPVDFSQKKQMKLLKGVFLGPQQSIVLNKYVKKII